MAGAGEPRRRCAGQPATETSFRAAAEAELADAAPLRDNAFKIELAKRTIVAVLCSELSRGSARMSSRAERRQAGVPKAIALAPDAGCPAASPIR